MKIAIDAMGGDNAPSIVIEGVSMALKNYNDFEAIIVGHEEKISSYIAEFGLTNHSRVTIVHADEVVEMGEPSTAALRSKKRSSITVAATLVAKGKADAVVSAGHTGAAVAATKVKIRTMPGIERPAIATIMPAKGGHFILCDAGANTDCKPENLAQFAIMAEAYSKLTFGIEEPKIGLLSVGEEDAKGNELTKETFKILSEMPINFIGNVEGNDMFAKKADVVVCDGFVGNVVLKTSEGLAKTIMFWLKESFTKRVIRKIGAILAKGAFNDLRALSDKNEYGGAPLLGLKKPCIIGHGSSNPTAIMNAIRVASEFVKADINGKIAQKITESDISID